MTVPTIVSVSDVSKRFTLHRHKSLKERIVNRGTERAHREDFWALRDISFDIPSGSTLGLVGHNGSGKSTLLKVIGGIIEPSSGTVRRRGRMAALLELGAGFHPDLTGRENVYLNAAILGLTQKEIDRYFDAIVDFSGIEPFIDTQVKFYSSGMYVRLAFAVAVHVNPDLLLVDEVLAVGDEPFQAKCMDKIEEFQREGRTIVVVSHSAAQVARLCDRVVVMNHGEMVFDGPPADGLHVLRFGYDEQRRIDSLGEELALGSNSHQNPAMITDVSIVSDQPADKKSVATGDDMRVSFSYELTKSHPPLVAEISIETPEGEPIYRLNTADTATVIPDTAGQHVIDFAFARVPLGVGEYSLRGNLETREGVSLDRSLSSSSFSVTGAVPSTGYLTMDVEVATRSDTLNPTG
ncbi:ABC transporter ATP-binding protein [Lysinimonas soli]|uniref:ABC transporter ATP-binding protein n=1 Tax=Lysinimonas soli TaxID=1074233 RepID=A0ABW0NVQ1_9MICO